MARGTCRACGLHPGWLLVGDWHSGGVSFLAGRHVATRPTLPDAPRCGSQRPYGLQWRWPTHGPGKKYDDGPAPRPPHGQTVGGSELANTTTPQWIES